MSETPGVTVDFAKFLHDYHLALGAFVDQFSQIENLIQMALWNTARVSGPTAKAIFSGVRTDVACAHVRRIFEAHEQQLPANLDRVFSQLSVISGVRNSIMHYGYMIYSDLRQFTSNESVALPNKAKQYPISPEILGEMTADLKVMSFALVLYIASFSEPLPDATKENFEAIARAPWQYKPASPSQAHKRAGGHPSQGKPSNQPLPSQE